MTAALIKERYYILTPLSFLLGGLVLIATLLLAAASYLSSIDKTVAGYGHMLAALDATLFQDMAQDNRRQLGVLEASLDKQAIAAGASAINPIWAIAHQFKYDAHFLYFYNARTHRLDGYPDWQQPEGYRAQTRPWFQTLSGEGDDLVWFGPYPAFDSARQVLTLIKRVKDDEGQLLGLLMVVLPALALLCIWLCSLWFLVRIFRQEQALVQGSLSGLIRDEARKEIQRRQRTWFVHGSLGEIEQVRNSLLQGQDALLHDPLTGILNRRAFDQQRAGLEQAGRPYWLVLFDVDNFKRVNDSWGHGVGDAVLFRVATIMARTLGDERVYRIGGDEFAALLPWEQAEVECRLTHLLGRVKALKWREFADAITLSAGGARYPDDALTLLERADACLYESKHQGRDCWHLAASSPVDGEVVTVSV